MGTINQKNKINYNYRYERKFLIDYLSRIEIENIVKLLPGMFGEIYHERFVNNIYFDSPDLNYYNDNINGSAKRKKVRIRWYGSLNGQVEKPILELKLKDGLVGGKISFHSDAFDFNGIISPNILIALIGKTNIPNEIKTELSFLQPTLVNRYMRSYYQTKDGKFRITIDDALSFFKPDSSMDYAKINNLDNIVILELKYLQNMDSLANQISSKLPFRLTKSSKYVNGIDSIYNNI